jgi:cytochrome c biogenesis protein CcdA
MKKVIVFFTILALIFPVFAQNSAAAKPEAKKLPEIYVFESPHCGACIALIKEFLPGIQKKYDQKITWVFVDTSQPAGLSMLFRISDIHKRKNPVTPSILTGNIFLSGTVEIKAKLEPVIKDILSGKLKALQPYSWQDFASMNTLMFFFKKIKVWTVAVTGLVDGVNPCAFAVIAFFLSFLAIYGYRRREILFVGSAYCAAVFFTYILMGVGFFEIAYRFPPFQNLKSIFYYMISGFCFVVFLLAIYDFIKFQRSGKADGMVLQLPEFLRRNIRHPAGEGLSDKKDRSSLSLVAVSFFIGILVAFLDGSCTAQLYFPAAAFISQSVKIRLQAFSYLFLYNIMFILPLIFVFGLLLWGASLHGAADFIKKHIGSVKIAVALIFLAMGVITLFL